ncbi:hypothetical protein L3Q82_021211, partial [Scortum barcoo]
DIDFVVTVLICFRRCRQAAESPGVTVVQLSDGQTVQVQGVIQAPQTSVIQSPQVQTVQIATVAELEDDESFSDTQKRREILSRRPSYRKILNELSSDSPAVPKIDEEKMEEEVAVSSAASASAPTSIYQTSSGQYIAISQGRAIQLTSPGAEALQGAQTLTVASSPTSQPAAAILQCAAQAGDSPQQFYIQGGQVLIQGRLSDLLLQLLLKLFGSTHFSFLLGSELLLHIRASFLDETDQLAEDLLAVLHCFISRAIDGLHLLLKLLHIFLSVLDSLLDVLCCAAAVLDYWKQEMAVTGDETESAATGDIPAYQLRSPNSGLAQSIVMAASPGSMQSPSSQHSEEITRKREVRLMKNREAARECRRKKKEYVKCLENRVAVLENQNKTLIEELKALKDIYCHKAE